MKTKEELESIKKKVKDLREELRELTAEELQEVTGGIGWDTIIFTDPDDISDDTKNKITN